jgi:hypothetical protein
MKFNIFEGGRRIALLIGGIVVIGTLIALALNKPYVSAKYSIASPKAEFVKMQESCPSDAAQHYFTSKTSTKNDISIDLCILAMSFNENGNRLIPYKIDEKGIWGASNFTNEIQEYRRILEGRFKLSLNDEVVMTNELSQSYRDNWIQGLGYLIAGLAVFASVVGAIGWIVRGFLGIPRGMDKRPE